MYNQGNDKTMKYSTNRLVKGRQYRQKSTVQDTVLQREIITLRTL